MPHQRLAGGHNRAIPGDSAFVRNYLEQGVSVNVCTQVMDHNGYEWSENFSERQTKNPIPLTIRTQIIARN